MKAHRALKKALRDRKRQRTLTLLRQAEMAAQHHDVRGLFGVVNLLCPNKQRQKIRLRDKDGNLMRGEEECRVLAEYAKGLFMASEYAGLPLLSIPPDELALERWHRAAAQLKAEKAAPNQTPPLRNWKQHSALIVPVLHKIAVRCLCGAAPKVPAEWSEVQLAWLSKPRKCPSVPENLRTVGLMAGDTKMFMSVLKDAVSGPIMEALWDIPQFAYRQLSSTIDALLRGSLHCDQVRALAGTVNTDVTTKLLTGHLPELTGGMMMSLDLAKAFDCMPFGEMYVSLREVGVSDELARLVVETHRQSMCVVRHCGYSHRVCMKRGLRQGCPLAPSVFTAWTIRLCRILDPEWCRTHTSLFADDVHGHWVIQTIEQFQQARKSALQVIIALHRSGMKVNFDKSVIVLLLRGRLAAGLKQRFVQWHKNRYVLLLGVDPTTGREVRLPIEDRMEYLGAVLSYGPMEMQTAEFRASRAWTNFTKLRNVLRTASCFSVKQKLRLFKACVIPAMMYGIIGVGVSASSLRKIQSTFARMLRKVLRVYEHGVSNHTVLGRAAIDPNDQLRRFLEGKARALSIDGHQSHDLRAPAQMRIQVILKELARLSMLPKAGLIEIDRTADEVTCSICGIAFPNQKSLEAHFSSKHAQVHIDARTPFDRRNHTLFGLPHCRLCRKSLYDWASMERHITEGRCSRLKLAAAAGQGIEQIMERIVQEEAASPPKPPDGSAAKDEISPALLTCDLSQLPDQASDIAEFSSKCILCAQKVKASGYIKTHWQTTHKEAWHKVHQDALSGARSLRASFRRPCQYCGSSAKHGTTDATHHATKCSPLFQVLAVRKLYAEKDLSTFSTMEAWSGTQAEGATVQNTRRLGYPGDVTWTPYTGATALRSARAGTEGRGA